MSAPTRHQPAAGRIRRTVLAGTAVVAGLATVAGCTDDHPSGRTAPPSPATVALVGFTSCGELLAGLRAATKASIGPYGFGGVAVDDRAVPAIAAQGAGVAQGLAEQGGAGGSTAYSTTNTAEPDADEPDLVKTDGHRIVTVTKGVLRVIDAASRAVTGELALPSSGVDFRYQPPDLLLSGDHVLVLQRNARIDGMDSGNDAGKRGPWSIGTGALLVDIAGTPRVLASYTIDGFLVDARQVGSVAHLVVRSAPRLNLPQLRGANAAKQLAANRVAIDQAGADTWLPRYTVAAGGKTSHGTVPCDKVSRPAAYSGGSIVTVTSFDLNRDTLGDGDPVSVVADANLVYSTGSNLYVVDNNHWMLDAVPADGTAVGGPGVGAATSAATPLVGKAVPVTQRSEIYQFDISSGRPEYVAAGAVPGYLLNQYALSDWQGNLRVATTAGDSSTVYVLHRSGGTLERLGAVGGLGHGQHVYSVRFVGPVGYVVTFRQTDPLYTLDLRDPAHPELTGSLEINGYSAYLHPVDGNRLIGVGQDADDKGRVQGLQVSLFDVSDPASPKRLARYRVAGAHSMAEFDPHAFLYWPATGLLMLPITGSGASTPVPLPAPTGVTSRAIPVAPDSPVATAAPGSTPGSVPPAKPTSPPFVPATSGALALRVSTGSITELALLTHDNQPISRSLVVGPTLWTVYPGGLAAYDLATLRAVAWL